ncbi:efflux RND transporter periplasmic adaptor subunit [Corynebacterium ciconiae]|uniref:efflux RND transporter periplasmic adaptor subunit n=1 Tax=Corynebacterium ciconiae TaxID=227319 RepID=UPI00036C7C3F|nr:HlyD family efflux transporter periplasmic adaptor subunit [Corynebacterium ciconiae]
MGPAATSLTSADIAVVKKEEVKRQVSSAGTLEPKSQTTLSTTLTGPVLEVLVRPGDRVGQGQLLARIDASDVQTQLNKQRAEQAAANTTNEQAVAKAQQEANQQAEALRQGLNPEINAATTALTQAQTQLDAAIASGNQEEIAAATRAKDEAHTALEAARYTAKTQLRSSKSALEEAQAQAQAAATSNDLANSELVDKINSSEIYAQQAGIVTAVPAKEGKPAAEGVVTVADDSVMVIQSSVKEAEVPKLKEGMSVSFTTIATGDKKFSGTVSFVSPVATAEPAKEDNGKTVASFPIEIEVTGDREGLLLGSAVKAKITTESSPRSLVVPMEAVTEDGHVLVVVGDGEKRSVEKRAVEKGMNNDFLVAVTSSELQVGEKVIARAAEYAHLEGQEVRVE